MKIVIVEDHLMFCEVIKKTCEEESRDTVVGTTSSGEKALAMVKQTSPDVIILDLVIEDLDGFSVAQRVRRISPRTQILVISAYVDEYTVYRLETIGVHGFIDKSTNTSTVLREALFALENGKTYFSATFKIVRNLRHANPHSFDKLLSPTEQNILMLIGLGRGDDEIAKELNIAAATAQTHRSHILRKLDIAGTPKLIAYAAEHGFTSTVKRKTRHPYPNSDN